MGKLSTIVTLPYDPIWPALEWAKQNCSSYITNTLSNSITLGEQVQLGGAYTGTYINYYFGDEKDALIFRLKWK